MGRKKMSDEHKAKIRAGRKKRLSDNDFHLDLGESEYAIEMIDKFNYVPLRNGKRIPNVFFGSIPACIVWVGEHTKTGDITEMILAWGRLTDAVNKLMEAYIVK